MNNTDDRDAVNLRERKEVRAMSKSTGHPSGSGHTLEKSVEDILADAQPLPFGDEMIIEELSEDEQRVFLAAIAEA